jgi:hypothetical protein
MPSTLIVYRVSASLLWALTLWHSWTCRGLFVDGSAFLVQIAAHESYLDFYPPRRFAMIVAQTPIILAIQLGVTDLEWLGRLLSLGFFLLPTVFYHAALYRARNDAVLLGGVIATLGIVFMTTSFFIVGEYNGAYAMAITIAVRLVTADRLNRWDSVILVLIALLAVRTYEAFLYLGPLLVAMIGWQIWRFKKRPPVPVALHLIAAGFLLGSVVVAFGSIVYPYNEEHLQETWATIFNFWQNMQFDVAVLTATVIVVWALVRPNDLDTRKPYAWASIFVVLLLLSPLLSLIEGFIRPLAKSHYVARTAAGAIVSGVIVVMWLYGSRIGRKIAALKVLRRPTAARRFLAFACVVFLSMIPVDLVLTATWSSYLEALRKTAQTHTELVAFEDSPLASWPYNLFVENWTVAGTSLILRSTPNDALVLPPKGFTDWQPFDPTGKGVDVPDLGRFFWPR